MDTAGNRHIILLGESRFPYRADEEALELAVKTGQSVRFTICSLFHIAQADRTGRG
jgi:hypothetical protein